jgi:hypothetical protein
MWRRRHALQIVARLPEDSTDALRVLDASKDLVMNWQRDQDDRPEPRLALARSSSSSTIDSRSRRSNERPLCSPL